MTVAKAVAEALKAHEVECWFGMCGGFEDELDIEVAEAGIRPVLTRDEQNGPHMAAGYALATSKPGVCHGGCMAVHHMVTGLFEMNIFEFPVVCIAFEPPESQQYKRAFHCYNDDHELLRLLQASTKKTFQSAEPSIIPEMVYHAFRTASTGKMGAVAILTSSEALSKEIDLRLPLKKPESVYYPQSREAADKDKIKKATELLINAERPVIMAGGGVLLSGAWNELRELAELLAAPVVESGNFDGGYCGKGVMSTTHPLSVGYMGVISGGAKGTGLDGRGRIANELVKAADVLLALEWKGGATDTANWTLIPKDAKLIHIDVNPLNIGRNYPTDVGIVADAKLALQELVDVVKIKISKRFKEGENFRWTSQITEWRNFVQPILASDEIPISPARIVKELQEFIDKDTMVLAGGGTVCLWPTNYLEIPAGRRYFHLINSLGITKGMAIGAKLGAPEKRIFVLEGDGNFTYDAMELETAVREKTPFVDIVFNNSCLWWIKWDCLDIFKKYYAMDFNEVNFAKLAEAQGCYAVRVERPGEIKEAIKNALEADKPAVIEAITSTKAPPMWRTYL